MTHWLRKFEELSRTAERWFAESESDELFASAHYSAGDAAYLFCRDLDDLTWFATNAGSEYRRQVCLYRDATLPIRGIAGESLTREAVARIPNNTECLVLRMSPFSHRLLRGNLCNTHEELVEEVLDNPGEQLAIGLLPDTSFMTEYPQPDIRGWDHCVVDCGADLSDVSID